MEIKRGSTQASQKGPTEHFTGNVRIDPLFQPNGTQRALGAYVTFEPCSRTDWHTHPMGAVLIVTFGCGLVQSQGGPIETIRTGATPTTAMQHIAIAEGVEWIEKVTDEQSGAKG